MNLLTDDVAARTKSLDDLVKTSIASGLPKTAGSGMALMDVPKAALSGAQKFVGDLGAIPEAIGAKYKLPDLESFGRNVRTSNYADVTARNLTMSPTAQQVNNAKITDIGLFGGHVPTLPYLALKTAEFVPTTLAAGGIGKGLQLASRGAIGIGKGSVAGEALISSTSGASAQAQKIDATPTSELLKNSSQFADAYARNAHLPPAQRDAAARSELKGMAMPTGGLTSATAVVAGSALAGRISKDAIGGVFNEASDAAKGIISGMAGGFKREAIEESAQSALESIAHDSTTATFVDPAAGNLDSMIKNALVSGLEGGVLGGTVGGTIGAVQGRMNAVDANKAKIAQDAAKQAEKNVLKQNAEEGKIKEPVGDVAILKDQILHLDTTGPVYADIKQRIETAPREDLEALTKEFGISEDVSKKTDAELVQSLHNMIDRKVGVPVQEEVPATIEPNVETTPVQEPAQTPEAAIVPATPIQTPEAAIVPATPIQTPEAAKVQVEQPIAEHPYTAVLAKAVEDTGKVDPGLYKTVFNTIKDDNPVDAAIKLGQLSTTWGGTTSASARATFVGSALERLKEANPGLEEILNKPVNSVLMKTSGLAPEDAAQLKSAASDESAANALASTRQLLDAWGGVGSESVRSKAAKNVIKELQKHETTQAPNEDLIAKADAMKAISNEPKSTTAAAKIEDVLNNTLSKYRVNHVVTPEQVATIKKATQPAAQEEPIKSNLSEDVINARADKLIQKSTPEQQARIQDLLPRYQEVVKAAIQREAIKSKPDLERAIADMHQQVANREVSYEEASHVAEDYVDALPDETANDIEVDNLPDTTRTSTSEVDMKGKPAVMTSSDVKTSIKKFQGPAFKNIETVDKESELPESAINFLKSQNLYGERSVRGIYIPAEKGKPDRIILIGENIESPEKAVFVALHEAVHRGLAKTFGDGINKVLHTLYDNNAGIRIEAERRLLQNGNLSKEKAIEETLADMAYAGRAKDLNLWDKLVEFVNNWLTKHGFNNPFLKNSDIIEKIVAGAQRKGLEADSQSMQVQTSSGEPSQRTDIRTSIDPNQGYAQTMDREAGVVSDLTKFTESTIPKIQGWLHRTGMDFSTGTHINEFWGRILGKLMGPEVQAHMGTIANMSGKASATISKLDLTINRIGRDWGLLSKQDQAVMNRLAGESTRLKIFPDRPFEGQKWLQNPKDVAENKADYDKLVAMYKSSPEVKKVYDDALAHNERDFELAYGSILGSLVFTLQAPHNIWKDIDPGMMLSEDKANQAKFRQAVKVAELWAQTQAGIEGVQALNNMKEFRAAKLEGPYFHLGRFGDFMAKFDIADTPEARQALQDALIKTGQHEYSYVAENSTKAALRFETEQQWITVSNELEKLAAKGMLENYTTGKITENYMSTDSSNLRFVQTMLGRIDADIRIPDNQREATKEMIRRIVVDMMPEATGNKNLARRKGVPGYDTDLRRSFVKRSAANAYTVAHNSTRPETVLAFQGFATALAELQRTPGHDLNTSHLATDVLNHLKKRQDNILRPINTPVKDKLSAFGYTFFLASNIPYIISNLAQPIQFTLPVLGGRFGFTKTAGAMFRASANAGALLKDSIQTGWQEGKWTGIIDAHISVARSNLTDVQKKAMNQFIDSGRLEFTQQHGVGMEQERGQIQSTTLKAVGALSHYSETMNRVTAGLAAFDLEYARLTEAKDPAALEKATKYGLDMIGNTQFLYDTDNRAYNLSKRGVFGELTPLMTGFQQFNFQTMQLLSSLTLQAFQGSSPKEQAEAKSALRGVLVSTTMLAGVMGLPFVTAISAVYQSLGSDDDPLDARADMARWLSSIFGADATQVIMHGSLNAATGATFNTRLSLADILPFSGFLADRRDLKESIDAGALKMFGPSVGALTNVFLGADKIAEGDILKGMIQMMPAGLQGPLKYADLEQNGFTTGKGDKLPIQATDWEKALQFTNFTPAIKTELQNTTRSAQIRNALLTKRKAELGDAYYKALKDGDVEKQQTIGKELFDFIAANPHLGTVDIAAKARNEQRNLAVAKYSGTGVGGSMVNLPNLMNQYGSSTTEEMKKRLAAGIQ